MVSLRSLEYCALRTILIESRRQAGLTQRQLASRLQRPRSYVSKIEGGDRHVFMHELPEIASALRVDPLELFLRFDERLTVLRKLAGQPRKRS
jgi:transcriptional regulator with XRE-family HTH domain